MSRVFPGVDGKLSPPYLPAGPSTTTTTCPPTSFTVWKKSSLSFDCMDGFTVFDGSGSLVFRVDNYQRSCRCLTRDVVLMDGKGIPLLTLRPKIFSMHEQWDGFKGDASLRGRQRRFSIKKRYMVRNRGQAVVHAGGNFPVPWFYVEGDYNKRCCKIRFATGELAAEICRKQVSSAISLGSDVFSLIVEPGFDSELIMAFVIAVDRMSWKPSFIPALSR